MSRLPSPHAPRFSPQDYCGTTAAHGGRDPIFAFLGRGYRAGGAAHAAGSCLRLSETENPSPSQIIRDSAYDAENRWIGENVYNNGHTQADEQLRFAYDGDQIIMEFDKTGPGKVTASDLSDRYLWLPKAVDQLMADEKLSLLPSGQGHDLTIPGKVVWALADQLGTIRDLAVRNAQTGVTSVANHIVYDSFGNVTLQTNSTVTCLIGFTGRPFDVRTGLQNNLNRWYDPVVGRWISKDPIGYTCFDTNLSRYCHNCPTILVDSAGTSWTGFWGLVRLIGGACEFYAGWTLCTTVPFLPRRGLEFRSPSACLL